MDDHVREAFGAAGARPEIAREIVDLRFGSETDAVRRYADDFGPFVIARRTLQPAGRWEQLRSAFADLVHAFNRAEDGTARLAAEYLLITVDR